MVAYLVINQTIGQIGILRQFQHEIKIHRITKVTAIILNICVKPITTHLKRFYVLCPQN